MTRNTDTTFVRGTHAYIGIRPDGLAVAVVFDDPGYETHTANTVMEWIRDGRIVERLDSETACARLHDDHSKRQDTGRTTTPR
jgi:hypothetical protein